MTDLRFTLVTDGPADQLLLRPVTWLLRQHMSATVSLQPQWADLRPVREKPRTLGRRIETALDLYPCDLLLVHRDAERQDPGDRYREIDGAISNVPGPLPPHLGVVPVRMSEAWLLFDEKAVRRAAGNPGGRDSLPLPVRDPEHVPDPKALLHEALRSASGLTGRRLRKFNCRAAAARVAEYIEDFGPLRALTAFARLEADLCNVIRAQGWHRP
jgi:hypothetical protein